MSTHFDVIVVGAGPAGLTAGIYLARARKKTLIVDEGTAGGQMIMSHSIANYPGLPETSGASIARAMVAQARDFGCRLETNSEITRLELTGETKLLELDGEDVYTADAVILATGGTPRTLGVPGEKQLKGRGISYCATCDGDFFTGKDIVAIGGGNTALEESVALTRYANSVTVVHQFDHFQAHRYAIEEARNNPKINLIMESEVTDFIGDNELKAVRVRHRTTGETRELAAAGAFVFIGYLPNTDRFRDQVELNQWGEVLADDSLATSTPGVFVAGDSRVKKVRQITTAVADGTIAALAAVAYVEEHRSRT